MLKHRLLKAVGSLYFSGLFLSLVGGGIAWADVDTPDLNRENHFHQVYQNYNAVPTDINSWTSAGKGKSEKYHINSKDTLWDVSEVLFGDPNFWPKIWSLNAEKIENPHQIFPNQVIKFNFGTLSEPPTMEIQKSGLEPAETLTEVKEEPKVEAKIEQKKESKMEVPSDANMVASSETTHDDDSPLEPLDSKAKEILSLANIPPEETSKSKASPIPKSLPKWAFTQRVPSLDLNVKRIQRVPPPPEEILKFFISPDEISTAGKIINGELDQITASDYQYINVKIDGAPQGKKYYVVSEKEKIKDPISGDKGHVYQVEGELDLLEAVNSSENIYRAFVPKVIVPINVGSMLVPGEPIKYRATVGEVTSGKAWLIGGEFDDYRRLLYVNSLVYLYGEGVSEGMTYPIYKKLALRVSSSVEIENPRRIGAVKVVKVNGRFATGVLVDASEDIRVGDVTDPSLIPID